MSFNSPVEAQQAVPAAAIAALTGEVKRQKDVNAELEERLRRIEALLPQTKAAALQQ